VTCEIDVLDAQAATLEQSQTRTVEQRRHQSRRSLHVREHESDLLEREHHRQVDRPLGAHQIVQPRKVAAEHLSIEEKGDGESLVLGGRADVAAGGEIAEKGRYVFTAKIRGIAPPVELVISPHPTEIRLLRARAEMA
jgi:hypothetical protein